MHKEYALNKIMHYWLGLFKYYEDRPVEEIIRSRFGSTLGSFPQDELASFRME